MAKLDKMKPGDVLWTKSRRRMGNTMMRETCVHPIYIVEVDLERRKVRAHFNSTFNPPTWYPERNAEKWTWKRPQG